MRYSGIGLPNFCESSKETFTKAVAALMKNINRFDFGDKIPRQGFGEVPILRKNQAARP
jgi:hypothetical protein